MLETAESLAQFLNVSTAKLRKDTRLTDIPRVRIGRAVRFDREAVLQWLVSRTRAKRSGGAKR